MPACLPLQDKPITYPTLQVYGLVLTPIYEANLPLLNSNTIIMILESCLLDTVCPYSTLTSAS